MITPASAILIAMGASLAFAVADIFIIKGLQFTAVMMTSLVTVAVQWLIFTAVLLAAGMFSGLTASGVMWFGFAGFLSPVLFVGFYFLGFKRVGVARSASIKGSSPIFTAICAFVVLSERLDPFQYVGIALAVVGVFIILSEGLAGPSHEAGLLESPPHGEPAGVSASLRRKVDYLFPLMAGAVTGVGAVLVKIALTKMPVPLLGAWVGVTVAMLLLPLLAFLFPPEDRFGIQAAGLPWLALGGAATALAIYFLVTAIHLGQVSIVTTLNQTSPLFVMLFSAIFLRRLERLTRRAVWGGLLTVSGGVLVTLM
jgi:drug/metabolite transporter (DMT)-like permease